MPTPTRPHLQPHLDRLDHAVLVDLLRELCAPNARNRTLLVARLLTTTPSEATAPYSRILRDTGHTGWAFHDDLMGVYWELLPATDKTT